MTRAASRRLLAPLTALAIALAAGGLCACSPTNTKDPEVQSKADFHYKLANNYFYSGNVDLAIREVLVAIQIDPTHADAHHLYGFILFGRKQFEDAIEHFQAAILYKPDFFSAVQNLGSVYLAMSRWRDAIETLEPLTRKPSYTTPYLAHNNVGWAYLNLNDLANARKHLQMAVFLNPKFCLGYYNLGLLAEKESDDRGALAKYGQASKACPRYAEPLFQMGEIYRRNAQPVDAAKAYGRCAELSKDSALSERCRARLGGGDG